jgi:hypothetical protein
MAAQGPEAITEIWWITKVVVPLGGILIASVIIPLLLHHLKYARERKERLFEARRNAYHEYFKKIEAAVSDAGQEYEVFSREVMPKAVLKLLKSSNSPEAIVEFQQIVGDFPLRIQTAYRKASSEITTLQIVCSRPLMKLAEEFEMANKKLLDKSADWLGEMKGSMAQPDLEAPVAKAMKALGEDIRMCKQALVEQMRAELGSDRL